MPAAVATWAGTPATGTMVNGWKYLGCQAEITGRVLRGSSYSSTTSMTIESCMNFCSGNNFGLAGVEYGQECYCDNAITKGQGLANPPTCTMSCKGNSGERCGGPNSISVFNNTKYVAPSAPAKVADWTYASCYMEPQVGRALPDKLWSDPAMTVDKCTAFCASSGYPWAGVEYGDECWCGKKLATGLKDASDPTCAMQCDMQCLGNNHQICGGAGAINVYKNPSIAHKRDIQESSDAAVTAAAAAAAAAVVARRHSVSVDGVFMRNGRFVKVRKPSKK